MKINTIENEECVSFMSKLSQGVVDLTVTSPPYDNLRTYQGYSFDFENVARQLFRITKDGGVVVWIVNDATIKGSESGTSFRQAIFFKECGFKLHDTMIWQKSAGALGSNLAYHQNFEYMFIFVKGKITTFNPIKDRKNIGVDVPRTQNCSASYKKDGSHKTCTITVQPFGRRHNIWPMGGAKNLDHPAPFPVQLVEDHILSWSNPGDLVYDPFMGSGSTALAAIHTKRNFIGSELSVEYVRYAYSRIAKEKASK